MNRRVMLLIDADNVSAGVVEQAVAMVMAEHGAIHVRRAYCTPESALTHQKLFKACSIRPIVNLSSGKNANDIALAVDAMDLAVSERPDVAVIVSSDSDFAPLVIRLREKGCRVEGIGQAGKTGDASKHVYDTFVDVVHKKKVADVAPPAKTARGSAPRGAQGARGGASEPTSGRGLLASNAPTAATRATPAPTVGGRAGRGGRSGRAGVHAGEGAGEGTPEGTSAGVSAGASEVMAPPAPTAAPTPSPSPVSAPLPTSAPVSGLAPAPAADEAAPRPARKRAPARKTRTAAPTSAVAGAVAGAAVVEAVAAPAAVVAPVVPDDVRRILEAVPDLRAGAKLELSTTAERLRAQGLLAKSAPSTRLFKKYPDWFALTPDKQPNKVQYRGR